MGAKKIAKPKYLKFTSQTLKSLSLKKNYPDKTTYYWKINGDGLGIRVSPRGKIAFVYGYKFKGEKRRFPIGKFPKVSLAKANEIHAENFKLVTEKGIDVCTIKSDKKRARNLSPTVKQFAETFIDGHCKPNKKSWQEDQRILETNVNPAIGKLKMLDVTRLDVRAIINDVAEKGSPNKKVKNGSPVMANRVLACLRKMFAYAVEEDVLEVNVCAGIPKKAAEKSRERFLSHDEIKELWKLLPETDIGNITRLLLISGQRTGETRQMEWSELNANLWTIPPEKQKKQKNKSAKPHLVPLPAMAMEIIENQKKKTGHSTYVFAGRRQGREEQFGDRCISEKATARAFSRIIEKLDWQRTTAHDLRRTMRSELSRLKVNPVVAEKAINHALPGLLDTYDMYAYLDEKAIALQKWSDCLEGIVYPERKKDNIIDLPHIKVLFK